MPPFLTFPTVRLFATLRHSVRLLLLHVDVVGKLFIKNIENKKTPCS
jgi:hypothetical protein